MSKKWLEKLPVVIAIATLFMMFLVGSSLVLDMRRFIGSDINAALPGLAGRPSETVIEKLGTPRSRYSGTEYLMTKRERIQDSFQPPPPSVICDEVFEYTNGNYMGLLFITDGQVTTTYWGRT